MFRARQREQSIAHGRVATHATGREQRQQRGLKSVSGSGAVAP